jgi:Ca2+-binding RTX toxin-like protein
VNIEGLIGSAYGDILNASDANNELRGNAGNDQLRGYGGNDIIDGGSGSDKIWGEPVAIPSPEVLDRTLSCSRWATPMAASISAT